MCSIVVTIWLCTCGFRTCSAVWDIGRGTHLEGGDEPHRGMLLVVAVPRIPQRTTPSFKQQVELGVGHYACCRNFLRSQSNSFMFEYVRNTGLELNH